MGKTENLVGLIKNNDFIALAKNFNSEEGMKTITEVLRSDYDLMNNFLIGIAKYDSALLKPYIEGIKKEQGLSPYISNLIKEILR